MTKINEDTIELHQHELKKRCEEKQKIDTALKTLDEEAHDKIDELIKSNKKKQKKFEATRQADHAARLLAEKAHKQTFINFLLHQLLPIYGVGGIIALGGFVVWTTMTSKESTEDSED